MKPITKGVALLSFSFQKGIYLATFQSMNDMARKLEAIFKQTNSDWFKVADIIGVDVDYLLNEIKKYRMNPDIYAMLKELYEANREIANGTGEEPREGI